MQKEILYGIIGLLLGVILTSYVASNAVNNNNTNLMGIMGIKNQQTMMGKQTGMMRMDSSMKDMMNYLKDKSADDFDKAFLSSMIVHHQGAIEMAKEAKEHAAHVEIKKMADEIISAQSREIGQMEMWQQQWGY